MNDFLQYTKYRGKRNEILLLLQNHINLGLKLKLEWTSLALVYSLSDTMIIIKRKINAKKFSLASISHMA